MSNPTELIKTYQERIIILQKEIDSHPFNYSPGYRWKDESNFWYRKNRENEIDDLKRRIQEERNREQLLSHNILNKQLKDNGIEILKEQNKPLDNFIRVVNEGNPVGIFANKIGKPIAEGVGSAVSSPIIWIVVIIGAVIILPLIFRK